MSGGQAASDRRTESGGWERIEGGSRPRGMEGKRERERKKVESGEKRRERGERVDGGR